MEDGALASVIERLCHGSGDQRAWDDLYQAVFPYLFATMFRAFRGSRYLSDEAVQEVMVRLLRNYRFEPGEANPRSLMAYLKLTARSVIVDMVRRQRRDDSRNMTLDVEVEPGSDIADGSVDAIEVGLAERRLRRILEELDERDRRVVEFLLEGRNLDEIAKALNVAKKTASNRISAVRKEMRLRLFPREEP